MTLAQLLAILPKHERDRLMQAAAIQQDLLNLYISMHRDLINFMNALVLTRAEAGNWTSQQTISLLRSNQVVNFINNRISVLNTDIGQVFDKVAPRITDLTQAQVTREMAVLGTRDLVLQPPDPRLLERTLEQAVSRISSWNRYVRPELLRTLREGLLKGEDNRQLRNRVSATRVTAANTAPVARARAHMLANTRYAVVQAANAAREEGYTQSRDEHGIPVRKMWLAAIQTCCRSCALLHGQIVDLGTQFQWRDLNLSVTPYRE